MSLPIPILIKYHNQNLAGTIKQVPGSAWIDLRAAETVEMEAGEFRIISLGISVDFPDGYEAHIAPRSSTFKNYGVLQTNGVGVIEASYRGENDVWGFPALAMRKTVIHEGDRICQFRIIKQMEPVEFIPVNQMIGQSRGGFGSTGVA